MPVFQPLKDGQVIPFWSRYILSVRWIGRRPQLHWDEKAEQAESYYQQRRQREIHQHLARVEEFRFLFGMVRIFVDRSGRSSFAEQKNMGGHKREDKGRNQKNV